MTTRRHLLDPSFRDLILKSLGRLPRTPAQDDRYELVPDENHILDRHTGQTYGVNDALKILFGDRFCPAGCECEAGDAAPTALKPFDPNKSNFAKTIQRRFTGDKTMFSTKPKKTELSIKKFGGDQDPTTDPLTADDLLSFVQICFRKLDPDQQSDFLSGLSSFLDDGAPAAPADDQRRRGMDARERRGRMAADSAMRSRHSDAFERRWGEQTRHISVR